MNRVLEGMPDKESRFENLVHAYSSWLYRYAYWLAGEQALAEDLVQETFLRAWRFLDALQDESSAKAWLTTILRRENARKFEKKSLVYTDTEMEDLPSPQHDFDDRPESVALHQALRDLPVKYREPLMMQVLDGYSLDEIAEVFELPRNTVATRLHRARQRLRRVLEGDESDASEKGEQL